MPFVDIFHIFIPPDNSCIYIITYLFNIFKIKKICFDHIFRDLFSYNITYSMQMVPKKQNKRKKDGKENVGNDLCNP